jgi:hypothetical protein
MVEPRRISYARRGSDHSKKAGTVSRNEHGTVKSKFVIFRKELVTPGSMEV